MFPPPYSPCRKSFSLLQTLFNVHVMHGVVHPPHSWSLFCSGTSDFHLHNLLYLIFCIHPQKVFIQSKQGVVIGNKRQTFSTMPLSSQNHRNAIALTPCNKLYNNTTRCHNDTCSMGDYILCDYLPQCCFSEPICCFYMTATKL